MEESRTVVLINFFLYLSILLVNFSDDLIFTINLVDDIWLHHCRLLNMTVVSITDIVEAHESTRTKAISRIATVSILRLLIIGLVLILIDTVVMLIWRIAPS